MVKHRYINLIPVSKGKLLTKSGDKSKNKICNSAKQYHITHSKDIMILSILMLKVFLKA